ncbi:hypothetical protein SB847_21860, partial [Bacillus sp. SIMBA_026]|uniref:hypothetical protein n=1 Tax=Bacillus sp. SIMBA_026 TaxID=3085769 RepID=UPI00397E33D4
IVKGAEVGYLKMDDGVFACFEVDLSNFETVYGDMYKFIFSQQTDFISSVSYDLESSSYDAFVRLFLKLSRPNDFLDDFNPD